MLRKSLIAAALALASIGTGGFVQPAPMARAEAPRPRRGQFRSNWAPSTKLFYGTRGAGITMAQQKRAARKARNVSRHKQHVRGAK